MHISTVPWRDPLQYLAPLPEMESFCLLYSGLIGEGFGRFSFLAIYPKQTVKGNDFPSLDATKNWLGYLGYGLKNTLEKLPQETRSQKFPMPDFWMAEYHVVACFDHFDKTITLHSSSAAYAKRFAALEPTRLPALPTTPMAKNLSSNMTKQDYMSKVEDVLEAIRRGDVYQANLTRKFYGEWAQPVSPLLLFNALCRFSPAPYSALLKCGDTYVLSSSPELFLEVSENGKVTTKPIKGSAPRARDLAEDKRIREQLAESEKNRAENLMIVDLMRNDLSRSCEAGSIKVESLHDITSYLTVHHMSSTIVGQKQKDKTALDVVKGCFPAGSMTGAPKIKAMELCSQLEQQERGIYSGAIGWLGANGTAHFSVVIRTLLMNETGFEFQVGGGIVADSTPESEWQETLIKTRGIATALQVNEAELSDL
jgi:aminodeoxychorismate synthase component I